MSTRNINIKVNESGAQKSSTSLNKVDRSISSIAKSALKMGAAYFSAQGVINGFKFAVQAAGQQELAEKKLETALGKTSQALLDHASALQQQTTYGDEAIIEAEALIAAFTKDEDQIKSLTTATLDLAAAKGMDLKSAADLVAKSFGSSTNALTRYGVEVEGAAGSSERLQQLTKGISDLWGGQAAAAADTMSGSVQQMKNALGDVAEVIGQSLSPLITSVAGSIANLAGNFTSASKEVNPDQYAALKSNFDSLALTIDILSKKTNLNTGEMELRSDAIRQLQDQYPNYFKGMNLEKMSYEEISKAIGDARIELADYAKQMAINDIIKDYQNEIVEATRRITEFQISIANGVIELQKQFGTFGEGVEELGLYSNAVSQQQMLTELANITFSEGVDELGSYSNAVSQQQMFTEMANIKMQEYQDTIDELSKKIALAKQNLDQFNLSIGGQAEAPTVEIPSYDEALANYWKNNQEFSDEYYASQEILIEYDTEMYQAYLDGRLQYFTDVTNTMASIREIDTDKAAEDAKKAADAKKKADAEAHRAAINGIKMERAERASAIAGTLGGFAQLAATSKDNAGLVKVLMKGQAIIDTYAGANRALAAYPPPFGFIAAAGVVASGLANVAAINAQQFAEGGIVQGSSYIGDQVPIRANSGEMVLTQDQQKNLFAMANNGSGGGVTIQVSGNLVASEEEADRFAELIATRSRQGFNNIAVN